MIYMISRTGKNRITAALLAAIIVLILMLTGCSGQSGAELKVSEDLESIRYAELDPYLNAKLESMLINQ